MVLPGCGRSRWTPALRGQAVRGPRWLLFLVGHSCRRQSAGGHIDSCNVPAAVWWMAWRWRCWIPSVLRFVSSRVVRVILVSFEWAYLPLGWVLSVSACASCDILIVSGFYPNSTSCLIQNVRGTILKTKECKKERISLSYSCYQRHEAGGNI
jgi:hypothetical protein